METINSALAENTTATSQSPEEGEEEEQERGVTDEKAASTGVFEGLKSSTTSSPDTDSPVMINVDVSPQWLLWYTNNVYNKI